MGGNSSTSSNSGSGSSNNNNNNNQSTVNQGKKYVSDTLGLGLGGKANNLTGKDQDFYGREASKAADDFLISQNKAKAGNYFRQVGGEFVRISQEEGERLYKAGDPSISRSVRGTSESMEMKYGSSGTAMGSGDPTGILTGTKISEPMFKRQQNIQMAVLGAGAIVGVPLAATAFNEVRKKTYGNYVDTFMRNMASSTSMAASNRTTSSQNKTVADQTASEQQAVMQEGETAEAYAKRMAALTRRNEALKGNRTFFSGVKQTISGEL